MRDCLALKENPSPKKGNTPFKKGRMKDYLQFIIGDLFLLNSLNRWI
jgi:hypothetical protein